MRIYLSFAILAFLALEAMLVPRTIRDYKLMQKMRSEMSPAEGLPTALAPFSGYDSAGRPLALTRDETRWIVPIMVHTSQMSADLEYLGRLRKALARPEVVLVGICDASNCAAASQSGQAGQGVPVLAYGPYVPLTQIARLDDHKQVLLLNQFWGVRKSLRRATSAEQMAAEIQEVIGQ